MAGSYYIPLPSPEVPQNALLNFAPVNNALDTYREQKNTDFRNSLAQKESDRQDQELGLRKQQFAQSSKMNALEYQTKVAQRSAGLAQMALGEKDPTRKAAIMQQMYGLDPEFTRSLAAHGVNPNDHDTVANFVIAQARGYQDPLDTQAKKLGLQKTQAEISKLNAEAANGGEAYGKTGAVFLNPQTGQYEAVQFGGRGQVKRTPLGGLTPSKGVGEVDTGLGTEIIDKATGQTVRTINKDVAGAASLKEQGEAQGKAILDLPRQIDNATLALKTIQDIRNHPGKKYGVGAAGVLPGIPGTQQRGFVNLVDQAKGQAFLQAFNSLRGGGQITEVEGSKATQALARLDRAQTQEDFDKALNDVEQIVNMGLTRAQHSASRTPSTPAGTMAAPQADHPLVSSPEDAMKLPSGTVFRTPDGRLKVRP